MTARNGPPKDDAAREGSPTNPGTSVKGPRQKPHRHQQTSASVRRCMTGQCVRRDVGLCNCPPIRRRADLWREGFGCGFRDALRLAERELPPDMWRALHSLADRYDLAGSDG